MLRRVFDELVERSTVAAMLMNTVEAEENIDCVVGVLLFSYYLLLLLFSNQQHIV
jgi:hypothetical protein